MNKRIVEIDIAKGIGIILVVLGHLEALSSSEWKQFAASFHMPLFFFVAGVLGIRQEATIQKFKIFFIKKFFRIMVPYLLWSFIYSIPRFSVKQLLMVCYANNKTFAEAGLWFLPTMFMGECLYYLILALQKRFGKKVVYIAGVLFSAGSALMNFVAQNTVLVKYGYPFSFDIALTAAVFILCGHLFSEIYEEKIIPKLQVKDVKVFFVPIVLICFGAVYIISRINIKYITDDAFYRVVMARSSYGLYPLFLLGGILGSFGVLLLSCYIKSIRPLSYIGRNSLVYMCTNHIAIALFMDIFKKFIEVEKLSYFWSLFWCICALIFVLLIGTAFTAIINRYIPILNGKMGYSK